ncbi:hypothetical protein [Olivibacter domesticus]|uniref:Uncharacterized protein n=1 Tax=Olivibacter domesticus TaxID=407022 RepID=A0A1H7XM28_OLID1|nr:hypothetical protein [Olivibacter domesticus]SEM34703.1 hypothetical protein SAMN05661044_04952 [Olivibacter domesticus]
MFSPVSGVRAERDRGGIGGFREKKRAVFQAFAQQVKKRGRQYLEKGKRCVSLHSANEGMREVV